jgi:hypothetical protein
MNCGYQCSSLVGGIQEAHPVVFSWVSVLGKLPCCVLVMYR